MYFKNINIHIIKKTNSILTAIGIREATGLFKNCLVLVSYNGVNVINSKSVSIISFDIFSFPKDCQITFTVLKLLLLFNI